MVSQAANQPIIEVAGLVKQYGSFKAVNNISFQVQPGEIFGFLGPNGAGKSTTIKILTTLAAPTAGRVQVAGFDVLKDGPAVRNSIGIIFQDPTLDVNLSAEENLRFHTIMYHVPTDQRQARINAALTMVELTEVRDKRVKTFSGGMRRRLEIARGLLHRPRLLFLDEPTVGLDPQTRNRIWEYIRGLRDLFGTSIFMTTHYLDEAEYCDRIAIIDQGQIVALDTPAALKRQIGADAVSLTLPTTLIPAATEWLTHAPGLAATVGLVTPATGGLTKLNFEIEGADRALPRLLASFPYVGQIEEMQTRRPTLDDVFLRLTGRIIREEDAGTGRKESRRQRLKQRGRI